MIEQVYEYSERMFGEVLDEAMGLSDAELDEQLRAGELALRELQARQVARLAVAAHRGVYRVDGHRSMTGYLRASWNTSSAEAARWRTIATACSEVPELGDALLAGRVGAVQVVEIARVHRNPRTRGHFAAVAPIFVAAAEYDSHDDLRSAIDSFVNLADQDGAFAELASDIERRSASVHVVGGELHVRVAGGDPVTAEEVVKTFEWFVEREFERDVAERAEQHGRGRSSSRWRGPMRSGGSTRWWRWFGRRGSSATVHGRPMWS